MHESGKIWSISKTNGLILQELYLSVKHSPIIFAGPDDPNALGNTISARRGKCMDEKNTLESKEKRGVGWWRGHGNMGEEIIRATSIFMQPVILVRSLGPYDFNKVMGKWGRWPPFFLC